jgi:hypothetical protein
MRVQYRVAPIVKVHFAGIWGEFVNEALIETQVQHAGGSRPAALPDRAQPAGAVTGVDRLNNQLVGMSANPGKPETLMEFEEKPVHQASLCPIR